MKMDLGHILAWLVFGFIAGVIAKFIFPGRDPGGCIITSLLGIAGAFVGGFIARYLGIAGGSSKIGDKGFFIQLAVAVLGAVVILAVYRLLSGRQSS